MTTRATSTLLVNPHSEAAEADLARPEVRHAGDDEARPRGPHAIELGKSIPFFVIHAAAIAGVFALGWSWTGLALALLLYVVRMFGVTAGYHRYFSHRAYRTGRVMQFVLAILAMSSAQKGVLWWASHHRVHHKKSDQVGDVHSVLQDGFLWSHVGWILSSRYEETDVSKIRDFAKFPELRWLDRHFLVPPVALGVALFATLGSWGLVWGLFVSTVLLWHGTFTINSLSHMFGRRRYATSDNSKNNLVLAIVTLGEGWHNNHHHYQRSVNQGFFWWEVDITYYVLRALATVGLVWDLHTPPQAVRDSNRVAALSTRPHSPPSRTASLLS